MTYPIYQVDAFSSVLFAGNPAAVMMVDESMDSAQMQTIAAENNLSETAFLVPSEHGYAMRWFTPACEVELCGHATLASAHVLFTEGLVTGDSVEFETLSGILTVKRQGRGYEMDFPVRIGEPATLPEALQQRLGFEPIACHFFGGNYLVEVLENQVVTFDQSFIDLPGKGGVILTAYASDGFDIVSRYFGFRGVGIEEDPVTGSIHCQLAHYWAAKLDKTVLKAKQASARGGVLECELKNGRVLLRGDAVTFFKGEVFLPEEFDRGH